jgi:glycosyltransferase involved in cell wall biosynthesis
MSAQTAILPSAPLTLGETLSDLAPPSRVFIATDTYPGQHNGVAHSLKHLIHHLNAWGVKVRLVETQVDRAYSLPRRPEIKFEFPVTRRIRRALDEFRPEAIHIATEGPIGLNIRSHCLRRRLPFTTSFHTLWPDYLREHAWIPPQLTWMALRHFHNRAARTMTRSLSMVDLLTSKGFRNVVEWNGGVDLSRFSRVAPEQVDHRLSKLPRPILLYVGRVSVEKGLDEFLSLSFRQGTKVVVGDGAYREALTKKYPDAVFLGAVDHHQLPAIYSGADVFVFPSRTETFGCVMIEALACGVPVAAFPVTGPRDIVTKPGVGALDSRLDHAILRALQSGSEVSCRDRAMQFALSTTSQQFLGHLAPASGGPMLM